MAWPVTINGHTYTDGHFGPYSYVINFPLIVSDIVAVAGQVVADRATIAGWKAAVDTKHAEVLTKATEAAGSATTASNAAAVAAPALGLIGNSATSLAIGTGDNAFSIGLGVSISRRQKH